MRYQLMRKATLVLGIAIALSACQTVKLEPGKSIKLSPQEVSNVQASVVWDLEASRHIQPDEASTVKFGKIAAAKGSNNLIFVCGYLQLKQSDGNYSSEMLFGGFYSNFPSRLHNDRMLTSFLGKSPEQIAFVRSRCDIFGVII